MTDQLVFDNTINLLGLVPGTSELTGTVNVDYDANTVAGSLSLTAAGTLSAQTYTDLSISQTGSSDGEPVYTLTGTNGLTSVSIEYTGALPTSSSTTVSALDSVPLASGSGTVSSTVACFVSGTMIRTPAGDVAIEHLRIGDLVVTSRGEERPIKWLGCATVDCRRYADRRVVMPVRIAAETFGPRKPERDLFVSPGHAICVSVLDEVLVQASALVNGSTIAQIDVEEVTYWHLELESHDIILADGLPVESYADIGNRSFFKSERVGVDPDRHPNLSSLYCRPFVTDELLVRAVRARLRTRALDLGWYLKAMPLTDVRILQDGEIILPDIVDEMAIRFVLSAAAMDVWLLSETSIPADVSDSSDSRSLGLCIRRLIVNDGWGTRREISSHDPDLSCGFYAPEGQGDQAKRWTQARACLPATLWKGCRGHFFLQIEISGHAVPTWKGPQSACRPVRESGYPKLLANRAA